MSVDPLPTPSATAAGPYSPAVRAGDWIVCSGQIGIDPARGALVEGGVVAEARQALANLSAVLGDCGVGWEHVAKVTVFLATESPQSMKDVNAVYEAALGAHRPARSTIGVAWLPLGASIEVEAWAHQPTAESEVR